MKPPEVNLADLYRDSVWLRFLFDGAGRFLTVPGACLLWGVLQVGFFGLVCWSNGTLWIEDQPDELGLLKDPTALAYFFLLPFCFFLLHVTLRHFRNYLQNLDQVLESSAPASAHADLVQEGLAAAQGPHRRTLRVLLFLLGVAVALVGALTNLWPEHFYASPLKWDGIAHPLNYVLGRAFMAIAWLWWIPAWLAAVFEQFRIMHFVHRRMEERGWLRISPYALDHFGGLMPLATGVAGTGYLILAAGCFFLAPALRWVIWNRPLHVGDFISLGLYVIFAFIGIFLPTFMLQRVLLRKRTGMLTFLNQAFDNINSKVSEFIKEKQPQRLGETNLGQALETVDRLRAQWATLPDWPMSWTVLLRFVATVVIPAVGYWLVQKMLTIWAP